MTFRRLALPALFALVLGLSPLLALGRSEGSIQKTWDYPEGVRTLVIDADRHDIVLKAGGPRLTGRLVGDSGDVLKASKDGDTVTITARTDRGWVSWRQKTARIEVTLPPGLELNVTTASGAVQVLVPTNGLTVRTASGDIEATKGGSSADLNSASGDVQVRGFTGPTKASALSGDVKLKALTGEIQASSMSGDVTGEDLAPADKSRFTSVSGDVELELRGGGSAFSVSGESVSGDVEIPSGSGPSVVAKSVSGDVRVQ